MRAPRERIPHHLANADFLFLVKHLLNIGAESCLSVNWFKLLSTIIYLATYLAIYPAVYLATSGDRTLFLIVIEGNIVRYVLENLPAY